MPQTKTITTIQGDMWDTISRKAYGSDMYTAQLIAANLAHRYTAVFSAGVVLRLPDVPAATQAAQNMPPWMKGR